MKKTLTTLFVTTISALGFSQEQSITTNAFAGTTPHVAVPAQEMSNNVGTFYIKMGANESNIPTNTDTLMPELGVGYRHANEHHGMDISAEGGLRETRVTADLKEANYSYSLPKMDYLYYVSPASNTSFYAGVGAALGGLRQQREDVTTAENGVTTTTSSVQEFHGIIPNIIVGQEFNRKGTVKSFVQLEVSQPAIAAYQAGDLPTPRASLFVGAGF
jgi:hypothetical protein